MAHADELDSVEFMTICNLGIMGSWYEPPTLLDPTTYELRQGDSQSFKLFHAQNNEPGSSVPYITIEYIDEAPGNTLSPKVNPDYGKAIVTVTTVGVLAGEYVLSFAHKESGQVRYTDHVTFKVACSN